jgi:hypothetical protein
MVFNPYIGDNGDLARESAALNSDGESPPHRSPSQAATESMSLPSAQTISLASHRSDSEGMPSICELASCRSAKSHPRETSVRCNIGCAPDGENRGERGAEL